MKLTLQNVFPLTPLASVADCGFGNVKRHSHPRVCPARFGHDPNLPYLFVIKLCPGMFYAFRVFCAALFNHVVNIVMLRSKEKMIGIAARRVVAPVQYKQANRDRAVVFNPHRSMCEDVSFFVTNVYHTVSKLVSGRFPRPTSVSFHLDFLKKSIPEWTMIFGGSDQRRSPCAFFGKGHGEITHALFT